METVIYKGINIVKYYSRSDFKLEIPELLLTAGSITGVVGENGNGKTTLLNIIAGNFAPTSSQEVTYFDKTPKIVSDWINVKDKIAFIPQRIPRWFSSLIQNLELKAAIEKIPSKDIDAELEKILVFLGLKKYAHLKWSEISTGYRLRFELARMLIGKPQLIIIDEPIANLDINAQQQFLSDLKKITRSKEYPLAVIISTQQLHEIETIATQMVFLKNGEAIFSSNNNDINNTNNTVEIIVSEVEIFSNFIQNKGYDYTKRGVYYQVDIGENTGNSFLNELIAANININYYRDISKSTKKLF